MASNDDGISRLIHHLYKRLPNERVPVLDLMRSLVLGMLYDRMPRVFCMSCPRSLCYLIYRTKEWGFWWPVARRGEE